MPATVPAARHFGEATDQEGEMLTERARFDPAAQFPVKTFDVEYRREGSRSWLARIYQPQGTGPFPALLDVHGGAWCRGDRLNDALMNEAIAAAGVVVAAIDFRVGPADPYPASIADINFATRWLKAHAEAYGGDPRTVGAMGSSSGGHQVVLSGMKPFDPRYAAIPLPEAPEVDARLAYAIACWPVIDPVYRYHYAKRMGFDNLVSGHDDYWRTLENMSDGSPQEILDRGEKVELPPVQLIQGTADVSHPLEMIERFVAAYRQAGGEVDYEPAVDQPSGWVNTPGPESDRAIRRMKEFIARHLPH
jgi:acetyl esterase